MSSANNVAFIFLIMINISYNIITFFLFCFPYPNPNHLKILKLVFDIESNICSIPNTEAPWAMPCKNQTVPDSIWKGHGKSLYLFHGAACLHSDLSVADKVTAPRRVSYILAKITPTNRAVYRVCSKVALKELDEEVGILVVKERLLALLICILWWLGGKLNPANQNATF